MRKNPLRECVKLAVSKIRKEIELSFNKDKPRKSGRSGNHGKKFNMISTEILRKKNDDTYIRSTGCFKNENERILVIKEFEKIGKQFNEKARSTNHL